MEILLLAEAAGVLQMGNISIDGSKVHVDALKSKAVSYKRLVEMEEKLRQEVAELLALGKQADRGEIHLPDGLVVKDEIALRKECLVGLAKAKAVLESRAQERYKAEQAEYKAKLQEREEKARETGCKPRGSKPKPPEAGPRDKDQYNFIDPDSRIMKNSTNNGFDQHYNVQVAVDQESFLVIANGLSNHPNDKQEAVPTLDAIDPRLGKPKGVAMDNGYFSIPNIKTCEERSIEPFIAAGKEAHYLSLKALLADPPEEPDAEASPTVKMAYKLQTEAGHAIYRLRKCTVEPVIGIIKEILGLRQFSLRGLLAAAGEWCLVCLAFNLKRLHTLYQVQGLW